MTVIEFFDSSATENLAGLLYSAPEKAIFVGDNRRLMDKSLAVYREVLAARGITTALSYKAVNKNKLKNILAILSEIIAQNEDCVFDLTGGEELYLVAVGILLERFEGRIRCRRLNFKASTATDPESDTELSFPPFALSVEENVAMHGGRIVKEGKDAFYTYDWDMSGAFLSDIERIWSITERAPRLWNAQISTLGRLDECIGGEGVLAFSFLKADAERMLAQRGLRFVYEPELLSDLEKEGLISSLSLGEYISFTFKNEQIKRVLTVAGQALELKIAKHLRELTDKDAPLYNDVRVGVVIDWDLSEHTEEYRTVNEVDVIAMKDAIPVFISCKNGDFDMEELYKLNTVANRFGGRYVKKVLVAAEIDKLGSKAEHIRARAEDMGIRLLENIDEISDSELDRLLRSVWFN